MDVGVAVDLAGRPEPRPVGRHREAVRGRALQAVGVGVLALDRRVLDSAREAVEKPRRWMRWSAPIALAASTVLVVSIVIETGVDKHAVPTSLPAESQSEAAAAKVDEPPAADVPLGGFESETAQKRSYVAPKEVEELSREARQQQARSVSCRYDTDGSLIVNCRLPAEVGELFKKAVEGAVKDLPPEPKRDVPAGTLKEPTPFSARRADGLALVLESFLTHETLAAKGPDRHLIQVNVDLETLRDRSPGCCEYERGPSMAAETARRFACDAAVVHLYEQDGEPMNVGRKTRTISAPLRRLLTARDKGCRFPGCCNKRYIDFHHIKHWANGGETKPSNLVSLCRFHHRAVHEGGMKVQIGTLRRVTLRLEVVGVGFVSHSVEQADGPPGDKWVLPRELTPEQLQPFKAAYERSLGGALRE